MLKIILGNHTVPRVSDFLCIKLYLNPYRRTVCNYGVARKKSNVNKTQIFQNIVTRNLKNASTLYVSNFALHADLKLKKINDKAKYFYKMFHNHLGNHTNLLIKNVVHCYYKR